MTTQQPQKSGIPVMLWIVVALAALATAVVIAALAFADDEITKPLLVTFFGVISTAIPAIIALYKVGVVDSKVDDINTPTVTPHTRGDETLGRPSV
jgi:hypothetical protein